MGTDQPSLSLQMSISEILDTWPEVIPVFLIHKMACVGCSLADFMTLEDALDIYKLNEESFIEELEKIIKDGKSEVN